METEIWKQVVGFDGNYQVSNLGRVKGPTGKCRKFTNLRGYLFTGLKRNGKGTTIAVHRLVAIAFIPNPNNYPQVNHMDCCQQNNRVENLEWCTNKQNHYHARANGRFKYQLTPEKVRQIRQLKESGKTNDELAEMFGVKRYTVRDVVCWHTWKSVV